MKTIIGIVIKDIKVETTIILDMLSTISLGEYIEAIKYVKIALGIADWINTTPAATPERLKIFISIKPIIGPIITLPIEVIIASLNEKIFIWVSATPNDIKIMTIIP